MRYDICCIGHVTLDKVVTPAATVFMPGGTAYYFSHAVANLSLRYLLVTAVAKADEQLLVPLQEKGIAMKRLETSQTVIFENRYGQNPDERTQSVLATADPFLPGSLVSVDAGIFHLGPLLAADIPQEVIPELATKGKVSLDVQGLLRKVEAGAVVAVDWAAKQAVLPFVHFLKASEEEAAVLTGRRDVYNSVKQLADWGVKEAIVTLGSKGSVICAGGQVYRIPAFTPAVVVDATGCGDTYMAGYLYRRAKGDDIPEAGVFGAAMATAKIAASGPFTGTEADVITVAETRPKQVAR